LKSSGFTTVAILTLTLGIGANTAIFCVADALITHPCAGSIPIGSSLWLSDKRPPAAAADYFDWTRLSHSFDQLAVYRQRDATLIGINQPERVYATDAIPNFFATIRAEAAAGRTFSSAGEDIDASAVVVLSHGLWREWLA
jgi:hypothetical protein